MKAKNRNRFVFLVIGLTLFLSLSFFSCTQPICAGEVCSEEVLAKEAKPEDSSVVEEKDTTVCKQGEEKPCFTGDKTLVGKGICQEGKQTCENGLWSQCKGEVLPSSEVCDGKDNDCNGQIDETFAEKGKACSVGVGECKSEGVFVCAADGTKVDCDAKIKSSSAEVCDGLDNDCNGKIDETFTKLTKPCEVGVGECKNIGVYQCSADKTKEECSVTSKPTSAEVCDGKDNDCNGQIDESFAEKGKVCSAGVGECKSEGVFVCATDGTKVECDAKIKPTTSEICDGKDNDCDGNIDNDADAECFTGDPKQKNVDNCKAGKYLCKNGVLDQSTCVGEVLGTQEECDGKDNDCDGQIDQNVTKSCYSGDAKQRGVGVCTEGTSLCTNGTWGACQGEGKPSTKQCNGKDNDCDGLADPCPFLQIVDDSTGSEEDVAGMVVDKDGNTYVTGSFVRTSLSWGSFVLTKSGKRDPFIAKLDPAGNVEWIKNVVGTGYNYGQSIQTDSNGNVYFAGTFSTGTVTLDSTTLSSVTGTQNSFLFQLDSTGKVLWGKVLATQGSPYIRRMVVDSKNNLVVLGSFGTDLTMDSITLKSTSNYTTFLAFLDSTGKVLSAFAVGQDSVSFGRKIVLDASDQIYITGTFETSTFKMDSVTLTKGVGYSNGFILKLDAKGKAIWGVSFVSPKTNDLVDIVVTSKSEVIVLGHSYQQTIVINSTSGTNQIAGTNDQENYAVYFTSAGAYSKHVKIGVLWDYISAMAIDSKDNVYITGQFQNALTINGKTLTTYGGSDVYILVFDSTGTLQSGTSIGGAGSDSGRFLSISPDGYMIGVLDTRSTEILFEGVTHKIKGKGGFGIFKVKP